MRLRVLTYSGTMPGMLNRVHIAALLLFSLAGTPVIAWENVFPAESQSHLIKALDVINLTTNDLGFKKDVAKPLFVLPIARRMLQAPLGLPELGDSILAAFSNVHHSALWEGLPGTLLASDASSGPMKVDPGVLPELDEPLARFVRQAAVAAAHVEHAFESLNDEEQAYLAASVLGGMFGQDINATSRTAIVAMGVASSIVDAVIAENLLLDPKPSASNYLGMISRVNYGQLYHGARLFFDSVDSLVADAESIRWPTEPQVVSTYFGEVQMGTKGDDRYGRSAVLIIDPGGDDVYERDAGVANGLEGQYLSAIVDLGGSDRYVGSKILGPGAALFGVSRIHDLSGDDLYSAAYAGQAAGVFGVASLQDQSGDDVYRAHGVSQGAGYGGMGVLRDALGDDIYDVGFSGQAYAGVKGLGFLWDGAGDDRYISGGRKHDFDRHDKRYISTSQGFAIGMRPFAGGGVAALMDLSGNDTYVADVFGQGASYWYSVGMLLDLSGHDTYNVYHYGQGCGIHLSAGLLSDGGGDDHYTGYSLTQGNAHDYAVGMLFDHGGNDQYAAHEHSQGRGFFNSFGLLVDTRGNDSYLARNPDQCQGIGHDGHMREYGALGVLMDLQGRDVYAVDVEDGASLKRPYYGVIYDLK